MTRMERVMAALQGTRADKRAFTMTLSLYGAKLTDCPVNEYYTRPDSYLKGQIAVAEQCRPDIIFTPFALALEARAFGSDIIFLPQYPPNVKKPFIRKPHDIDRIRMPDQDRDENLCYLRTSARLLCDHFRGTAPICGVLNSPMDLPAIIMGADNWLELLLFDRKRASSVIALMSEYFVKMANSLFDSGIHFLAMAMVFNNPRIVFQKTIEEVVVPALADMFDQLNGPVVFHHGGYPVAGYLQLYRSLPNIAGFVLDSRDRFTDARRIVGDKMLLMGNLDGPSLGKISTARAIEKARKVLDDRIDDRHFIFATSAADVAWDTPLETLTGIQDLMRHYGAENAG